MIYNNVAFDKTQMSLCSLLLSLETLMMFGQQLNSHRIFKQRLWYQTYAKADLSLCLSHIPHCWKSHVTVQNHISIPSIIKLSSADNLCKQFGPRPGPKKCGAWPESKLFDTDGIPERIFRKNWFWNKIAVDKNTWKATLKAKFNGPFHAYVTRGNYKVCIPIGFPIHRDTVRKGLPMLYLKGLPDRSI